MPELVIGVIIALFIYERTGWSPGGVVTAGFIAMYGGYWGFALCTVLVAAATALAVGLLSRWIVLYGRRLFAVCVVTGITISLGASPLFAQYADNGEFAVIGHVIPGLVAKDMRCQGTAATLGALALAVGLTRLAVFSGRGWLW